MKTGKRHWGKISFGALGKIFDGSLAIERPVFRWLKGDIRRDHNPMKDKFYDAIWKLVSVA